MRRSILLIFVIVLCYSQDICMAQNMDRGGNDVTWDKFLLIKSEIDNGNGFSRLNELEEINDMFLKRQDTIVNDDICQEYAICRSSLAELYIYLGEYQKADSVLSGYFNRKESFVDYDRADKLDRGAVRMNFAVLRNYYYSQGLLYYELLDYEMARRSLEYSKNLFRICNDIKSIDYLKCLLMLTILYYNEDTVLACLYYDMAHEVFDTHYSGNSFLQAQMCYCQGLIDSKFGRYVKATESFNKVMSLTSQNDYDNKIFSVYALLTIIENDDGGEDNIKMAKGMLESLKNPFLKTCLLYYICSYSNFDDEEIDPLFNEHDIAFRENVNTLFSHFSALESETFWTFQTLGLLSLNNLKAYLDSNRDNSIRAYDDVVFTKSFLLKRKQIVDILNLKNNYGESEYRQVGKMLSQKKDVTQSSMGILELADIEKSQINTYHQECKDLIRNCVSKFDEVRHALGEHDVAIEFSFLLDKAYPRQKQYNFIAFMFRKGDDCPKVVKLCNYWQFNSCFEDISNARDEMETRALINNLYKKGSIYEKLWKPLEDSGLVSEGDTIYYSPVGDINKINFGALKDGKNKLLNDKYCFKEVLSTAEIVQNKLNTEAASFQNVSALVYGGIRYDTSPDLMRKMANAVHEKDKINDLSQHEELLAEENTSNKNETHSYNRTRTSRAEGFNPLKHTKDEADIVAQLLGKSMQNVRMYLDSLATEESFKAISGHAPEIIHIATHGFFMRDNADREMSALGSRRGSTRKNEEMLYSGLAFSGINNEWTGTHVNGAEDGILTAEEVSWMDLGGCKLVVLSACETGLGTTDPVDGVFGLQRGFKIAGVDKIVMSLWSVDDEATSLLMECFYKNLKDGKTCHDALKDAQQEMINNGYSDPYYWAGFVLLE